MEKEIQNVDPKKKTTRNTIPPKILKVRCNTYAEFFQNPFNECFIIDNFPDNLKLPDITPVLNKENYRPVIVLSRNSIFWQTCAKTNKWLYE